MPQYQELYDQLKETPHPHEVYTTLGEGDATRFVRLYCDLHPEEEVCFVACGGNGVIIEVATGLVGYSEYLASYSQKATAFNSESKKQKSKFTMAILYIGGTTKDFLINFPGRNFFSVKEMLAGTVTPVDIIRVNDSYSLNVCNIGFNSKVASRANELVAKGKTAHEAYTRGVVNAILTSRFNRVKVVDSYFGSTPGKNNAIRLDLNEAVKELAPAQLTLTPRWDADEAVVTINTDVNSSTATMRVHMHWHT